MRNNFYARGQSLIAIIIGIIIALVVVGLISGGVYYYLLLSFKTNEEVVPQGEISPPEEVVPPKEKIPPKEEKSETTCQDECSSINSKRCSNDGYQICGNYDKDDCLEWGSIINCSVNTICQNGNCVQQKCADGTPYNQCSINKPKYCNNGNLINKCSICGCMEGQQCQDGNCIVSPIGSICQSYEVCDGSILSSSDRRCLGQCKLPKSFDWRNRHGENWLTSVKSQGSTGACHEFGIIGAFEAQVNLYYNQHINLDLSEQMYVDCQHGTASIADFSDAKQSCVDANCWNTYYCKEVYTGLVDEACSPYAGRDIFCNGIYQSTQGDRCCNIPYFCSNWKERTWKNSGFKQYAVPPFYGHTLCENNQVITTLEKIKETLISRGPLKASVSSKLVIPGSQGNHSMVLVGYEEPDTWIFKNSFGSADGEGGYRKIQSSDVTFFGLLGLPLGPFIPPSDKSFWPAGFSNKINCVDKDNDSFCNWGISKNKPSTCPASCKPEKDWDDSDSSIGSMGIY